MASDGSKKPTSPSPLSGTFDPSASSFNQNSLFIDPASRGITIGLNAVIVAFDQGQPSVLVVSHEADEISSAVDGLRTFSTLPFGPFDPDQDRTLEAGVVSWVEEQTRIRIGYVEQLYTFGDRGRHPKEVEGGPRVLSVGYLALTRAPEQETEPGQWQDWYAFFPWEDWRKGEPKILRETILPALDEWAHAPRQEQETAARLDRIALCFGLGDKHGPGWDDEKVLERYELLYEASLVAEAIRDNLRQSGKTNSKQKNPLLGMAMAYDHRRILATAISRLRAKLKYRPVIFEMMPPTFTLLQLQHCVEALSGVLVHKQNFRRLVEQGGLVERTGKIAKAATGRGRPAEEFRFRRDVVRERQAAGVKLPSRRRK